MSTRFRSVPPAVVLLLCALCLRSNPRTAVAQGAGAPFDTVIALHPDSTVLRLGREFVVPGSLIIEEDSAGLTEGVDYLLDARRGIATLLSGGAGGTGGAAPPGTPRRLSIRLEYLPFDLREVYRLRTPLILRDTGSGAADTVYRTAAEFTAGDFFGPRLQKSGSLVRGIRAGSNRDVGINSGFRLEMTGELAEGIEVSASLTDENTPIQPEGSTQTLRELDRIFIELRSGRAAATLGDLALGFSEGRFGRITRKLRGAHARWSAEGADPGVAAEAGAASVRGTFASNTFPGVDGVQGPYRLAGVAGESPVIVIAGSERVFVDGREMTRGILNDYTIEYPLGEVTFMSRRPITFASRIVVEFEYADRRYERNFAGGRARVAFGHGAWSVGAMALREADDRDGLRDGELGAGDRALLAAAGDDPGRATRSGVTFAGPGKGVYEQRDTTVLLPGSGVAADTTILVYNPADTARAVYNAVFSRVPAGTGDYVRESAGRFRYAGPGAGTHSPVRLLPLAEERAFVNAVVRGRLGGGFGLEGELAATSHDRNTFSAADDGDNAGGAYDISFRYDPAGGRGDAPPGAADRLAGFSLRERRTGPDFSAPQRYDEVEFDRNWNTGGAAPRSREVLREAEGNIRPFDWLGLSASAGRLERGPGFSSERFASAVRAGDRTFYSIEFLRSGGGDGPVSSRRLRQEGGAGAALGRAAPRIAVRTERLADRLSDGREAGPGSYAFTEIVPGVTVDSVFGMTLSADLGYRRDDSARDGRLLRAAETISQVYGASYGGAGGAVTSALTVAVQHRRFDPDYAARSPRSTAMIRSLTRVSPPGRPVQAEIFYEASPEQASRPERLFVQVPAGTGNYRYAGDLNGNGRVDEPDFRLTRTDGDYLLQTVATDSLFPVLSLRAGGRIRFEGSRIAGGGGGWTDAALSALSGESTLRIEESSSDPRRSNLYLLRLGTFRNPATTLRGSVLFLQELHYREHDPEFSVLLRFRERRGLTRLAAGDEATYSREHGVRLRWSIGPELANRAEYRRLTDAAAADPGAGRSRQVTADLIELDWTYRPGGSVESTFGIGLGDASDAGRSGASLNSQRLTVSWLAPGVGRATAEFSREEAVIRGPAVDLPFELTQGRLPGRSWGWGISLEYRLTRFLESSLRYEGRIEGPLPALHSGSMDVRALF